MNRLFLLDAYALIFRAYYALIKAPRFDNNGFNTSAIFGFVNTLEEVLRKESPSHIAVCFDPAGPTFRSEAFEQYKGERPSTPEDIRRSVPIIKEIIRAYRIPVLDAEGFEADDVIGTMATRAAATGRFITYMMTPDKDFGQLVGPDVLQYKPGYRGGDFEIRGEKEICERYGLSRTSQMIDLLALMGDKADNIPGCPGVGEKTAVKLIADFGDVENLISSTQNLKGAIKKKVEENAEQIRFSKFLATIRTDVPLAETPDDLALQSPDCDKLFAIFHSLEFKSLADRVKKRIAGDTASASAPQASRKNASATPSLFDFNDNFSDTDLATAADGFSPDSSGYILADSGEAIAEMETILSEKKECGLFIVTEGENDMTARITGAAVAVDDRQAWYMPRSEEADAALARLMKNPDIKKVTSQAKRDMVVSGVDMQCFDDTALLHYIMQPDLRHDIATLSANMLRHDLRPMPSGSGRRSKTSPLSGISPTEIMPWACETAAATLQLLSPLETALRESDTYHIYADIEKPLVNVLVEMERTGVCIDVEALNEAASDMENRLAAIEREIHSLAGEEFNISSPAKVGEILFDRLALDPKAKKTKTGQYSTSEEVLEKVAFKHPIVGMILKYRQLKKLLSTYLTALPTCINPATGRIHTNYNQTVASTGRISSSSPNLQNIPVRDGEGREIRRAFIPSEGNLFLSADYSQIELRLVADFAGEEVMTRAFALGDDIHAATAASIYHKDAAHVTADERRHAKTANFGILYGITAFGLASRLGIPRGEAKELIDNYFAEFPGISKFMTESMEKARELEYVETCFGRRRYLPDINSRNPTVRGYAERNAVNAPVQGSAADIIKIAMIRIDAEMRRRSMKSKMIMQVHDELNFDTVPEELAELQQLVTSEMEKAYRGNVALTASCGVADNWLDAH